MPNWKRGITSSFLGYPWALFMSILWDSGGPLFGDLKGFKKVCFKSVFSPPPLYQMVAISEATSGCSHPGDHTGLTLQQVYLLLTTGLHLNLVSSVVFIFYINRNVVFLIGRMFQVNNHFVIHKLFDPVSPMCFCQHLAVILFTSPSKVDCHVLSYRTFVYFWELH